MVNIVNVTQLLQTAVSMFNDVKALAHIIMVLLIFVFHPLMRSQLLSE